MKLTRTRRGFSLLKAESESLPPTLLWGGLSVTFPSSPLIHWFICRLSKRLHTARLGSSSVSCRQEARMCHLSSLTCCVRMECVDVRWSCLCCLFIGVQTLWGTLCFLYANSFGKAAVSDSENIRRLCNGSAVIQDFAWSCFYATCAGYCTCLADCVSCNCVSLNWNKDFSPKLSVNKKCGSFKSDAKHWKLSVSSESVLFTSFNTTLCFSILAGYPSLRIEKNDLRSVTLMEAKAKVKDIAISRERVTLRDVLHEGTYLLLPLSPLVSLILSFS